MVTTLPVASPILRGHGGAEIGILHQRTDIFVKGHQHQLLHTARRKTIQFQGAAGGHMRDDLFLERRIDLPVDCQ